MDELICPICGGLREDCGDPTKPRYPQRHICYTARDQAAADRAYARKHEAKPYVDRHERIWAKDAGDRTPFHFRDGVRVWIADRDVNPDDKFI